MKKILIQIVCVLLSVIFSSCATLFSSSFYTIEASTPDFSNTSITYKNEITGIGTITAKVERKDIKDSYFTVISPGCNSQWFIYQEAKLRRWAIIGNLCTGGVGLIVDGKKGNWWKPNVNDSTITKKNHKHFIYKLNYIGCKEKEDQYKNRFVNVEK